MALTHVEVSDSGKTTEPTLSPRRSPGFAGRPSSLATGAAGTCVTGRSPCSAPSASVDGGIEAVALNSHPVASAKPPTICRDLRAAARSCASRAPRRVVATAEEGLSAPRATPISSWGGGGGANVSRDTSVATRPATSAGLGAHGPEQPRMLPAGNQARGLGDLTTNATRTTAPCPEASPTQILLLWAEGLRGLRKRQGTVYQLIQLCMCVYKGPAIKTGLCCAGCPPGPSL